MSEFANCKKASLPNLRRLYVALRLALKSYAQLIEEFFWIAIRKNRSPESLESLSAELSDRTLKFGPYGIIAGMPFLLIFGWHMWILPAVAGIIFAGQWIYTYSAIGETTNDRVFLDDPYQL